MALCTQLRADQPDRTSRCEVVRQVRRGITRAAILRLAWLDGSSPEELLLAVAGSSGWRVISHVSPPAYQGHGMRGEVELVSLRLTQLIEGGPRELDVVARYWQGEPEAECVRGPEQRHRTVCRRAREHWACVDLQIASGAERTSPGLDAEDGVVCSPRPLPAWSTELTFSDDTMQLTHAEGVVPESTRQRLQGRLFSDVSSDPQ